VQNDYGNLLKNLSQTYAAKQCYLEALRLQPELAVAWNNLACINLEENELPEALQNFSQAILLDPSLDCAYANMV
jgi:protein O-GlcNAc transferase